MFFATHKHKLRFLLPSIFNFYLRRKKKRELGRIDPQSWTKRTFAITYDSPLLLLLKKRQLVTLIRSDKGVEPENKPRTINEMVFQSREEVKLADASPRPRPTPNERTLSLTASFSSSFPLFPLVSPLFLPSSQGEKTSARTLDPLEDPIEFRGPRFIRLSRYTTASTCMKPGETKPMMEDHGSAASRWVEERKGTINHVLLDFEPEPTNLPGKVVVFR